jgi:hypothetical protein
LKLLEVTEGKVTIMKNTVQASATVWSNIARYNCIWFIQRRKKIISDLPTLIFSRYETGTTGFFLPQIMHKWSKKWQYMHYTNPICTLKLHWL